MAMQLKKIIRNAVALANDLTMDLQTENDGKSGIVTRIPFLSVDGSGNKTYGPPQKLPAIVDWKQRQLRTTTGELSVSRASVMFLDPKVVVDDDDIIILPDGTTGPILDESGFIDGGTSNPFFTEIWLG
jgi:hypothetical protein